MVLFSSNTEINDIDKNIIKLLTLMSVNFNDLNNKEILQTMNHNMSLLSDYLGIERMILYSLDPEINFSLFEYKKEKFPTHLYLTKNDLSKNISMANLRVIEKCSDFFLPNQTSS